MPPELKNRGERIGLLHLIEMLFSNVRGNGRSDRRRHILKLDRPFISLIVDVESWCARHATSTPAMQVDQHPSLKSL
jgi:hypothetical protein